jgi:hypothetical protein
MDIFLQYEQAINWVVELCPSSPDKFAHTYAGLTIWLLAALWSRKPLHSFWPLVPVIVFELANETMDRFAHGSWRWEDTVRDVAATWFWPFVLFGFMRLFPSLSGHGQNETADLAPPAQDEIDGPLPAMAPVRTPDGHDVGRVLAGGEPV